MKKAMTKEDMRKLYQEENNLFLAMISHDLKKMGEDLLKDFEPEMTTDIEQAKALFKKRAEGFVDVLEKHIKIHKQAYADTMENIL